MPLPPDAPALLRAVVPASPTDVRQDGADSALGVLRSWARSPTVWILAAQWVVFLALRLRHAEAGWGDLLVLVGVAVAWPAQEWAAHRWLLHLRPRAILGRRIDPFSARVHRYHHDHPFEHEAIFVPWPVILGLVPIHAALWWFLAPSPALALTGMLAYGGAALLYEWIHFVAHAPWKPRSPWLRAVQAHHRAHHFRKQDGWYAFTVPTIDAWLGTLPAPRE